MRSLPGPSALATACRVVWVFILILALAAPAVGAEDPTTEQPAAVGGWQCWGPGLPDPCHNRLSSAFAVSANDVWAVGDKGTILHWNGSAWTRFSSPSSKDLLTVFMAASNLGWAAGKDGAMLRWNGTQWSSVSSSTTNYIRAIALVPGRTATDGWAVADKYGVGQFLHTDGNTWKGSVGGGQLPRYGFTLYGMTIPTATSGWAVGERLSGGTMVAQGWSFDGTVWAQVTLPETKRLNAVAVNGVTVWAVGEDGVMQLWDGAIWQVATSLTNMDLNGIALVSPADGWAVGEGGTILRWNGTLWQTAVSPTDFELRSVIMISPTDGWAVGGGGTILRWNGSAWSVHVAPQTERLESVAATPGAYGRDAWAAGSDRNLYHWNGQTWQAIQGPASSYYSVAMGAFGNGWASGVGRKLSHWDGRNWSDGALPDSIKALAFDSPRNGWGVGWGKIYHYDGLNWVQVASPSTRTYNDLAITPGSEGNDAWAVGGSNTIVRWNGTAWSSVSSPAPSYTTLWGIAMAGARDGWATGPYGQMMRWNGTAWSLVAVAEADVRALAAVNSNDVWAVGSEGQILHWDGHAWSNMPSPTGNDLWSISMGWAHDGWAVGDNGVFLRYSDGSASPWTRHIRVPLVLRVQ